MREEYPFFGLFQGNWAATALLRRHHMSKYHNDKRSAALRIAAEQSETDNNSK